MTILIIGQQGYNRRGQRPSQICAPLQGWDIRTDHAKYILYFVLLQLFLSPRCSWLALYWQASSAAFWFAVAGQGKDRVRFSGYDVANFKDLHFSVLRPLSAAVGGGHVHACRVGVHVRPSLVGQLLPSIEMVIFCAIGGDVIPWLERSSVRFW